MTGHVLIIDALSNRRIHLRAQLDAECNRIELADSLLDGMSRIRESAPDVVILAYDLPGLKLPQVCKVLRKSIVTQFTTVIVAVPNENHSARVSALTAGAHDLLEYSADTSTLRARLRSLMRLHHAEGKGQSFAPEQPIQGLAEPVAQFERQIAATVVPMDPTNQMTDLLKRLPSASRIKTSTASSGTVRRSPEPGTDVFVLLEQGKPEETRETVMALSAHPVSRHSGILVVTDCDNRAPMPLDIGAHDQVSHTISDEELRLRIERIAKRKWSEDAARKATRELGQLAYTDPLTQLNNRRFADAFLERLDRVSSQQPTSLAILMIDVDLFKSINDNHGHAAGDKILAHIAAVLAAHIREGDMLARIGGEEFLVALPGVCLKQAKRIAERLRQSIVHAPVGLDDGPHVRPTISIGLGFAGRNDPRNSKDLINAADSALYQAKKLGRNRVSVASQEPSLLPPKSQYFG